MRDSDDFRLGEIPGTADDLISELEREMLITLQLSGQPVAFHVTHYAPGTPGTQHAPEEPPELEWHAESELVEAIIDGLGATEEVEEWLLAAIDGAQKESRAEALIERVIDANLR